MTNTKLTFYITHLAYGDFTKSICQTIIEGKPFSDSYDAREWISDNISEIIDIVDTSCVFDHVVVDYQETDDLTYTPEVIKTVYGRLVFQDESVLGESEIYLQESIKAVEEKYIQDSINNVEEIDTITENLKESIKRIKEQTEEIKKETARIKAGEKPKRKEYPSCWIEPNGKVHYVAFAGHNEFAFHYLVENEIYTEDEIVSNHKYAYEQLQDLGWGRILGWTDPPTFYIPDSVPPKQRQSIKEYCQSNSCNLPKEIQSY
jgi:hypothetical protein